MNVYDIFRAQIRSKAVIDVKSTSDKAQFEGYDRIFNLNLIFWKCQIKKNEN